MILLTRADDTRTVEIGGQQVEVPDLKIPAARRDGVSVLGNGDVMVQVNHNGKRGTLLLSGPHVIGQQTLFVVSYSGRIPPRSVVTFLKNQLGDTSVRHFQKALVQFKAVRQYFKAILNPYREGGVLKSYYAPHVICGRSPIAFDPDDTDPAEVPDD